MVLPGAISGSSGPANYIPGLNSGQGTYNPDGTPRPGFLGRILWCVCGSYLAILVIVHGLNLLAAQNRWRIAAQNAKLRAAHDHSSLKPPALPQSIPARAAAAGVAICREISNWQLPAIRLRLPKFLRHTVVLRLPSLGTVIILSAYTMIVLILLFCHLDPSSRSNFETLHFRAAWISISQLPLVVLLANKRSLLGLLIGCSPATLNIYHRNISRVLLLTASLHFFYAARTWQSTPGYFTYQVRTDTQTKRGIAAFAILAWLVFSSMAPIRKLHYSFFVVQHVISFSAFFILLALHAPQYAYPAILVAASLVLFDWLLRAVGVLIVNSGVLRWAGGLCTRYSATLEINGSAVASSNTTVVIPTNRAFKWLPGQYVYVAFPSLAPAEPPHPFTVASLPQDGYVQLNVASRGDFTRSLYRKVQARGSDGSDNSDGLDGSHRSLLGGRSLSGVPVVLGGPYGGTRDMKVFDTVVLLAGGTGASFVVPVAVDIVRDSLGKHCGSSIVRRLSLTVVVKFLADLEPYVAYLEEVAEARTRVASEGGVRMLVTIHVFVTCEMGSETGKGGCCGGEKSEEDLESSENDEPRYSSDLADTEAFLGGSARPAADGCQCGDAVVASGQCCCARAGRPRGTSGTYGNSVQKRLEALKNVRIAFRRPTRRQMYRIVDGNVRKAQGESAVASCGSDMFNVVVSRLVSQISDRRAVSKGSGAPGIYYYQEYYDM